VPDRVRQSLAVFLAVLFTACASSRGSTPLSSPTGSAPGSIQSLYEAGRDADVISQVASAGPSASAVDAWFASQSKLRLGQRTEALDDLMRLSAAAADPGVQVAARLAVARLNSDSAALEQARGEAAAHSSNVIAQYELGLSYAAGSDFAAAAQAFDRCIDIAPTFAYAYYQSALAYERVGRPDLMANRFDRFVRLAPNAPERPQVDSVLRTVGGRP
jgi:tetratricopeptide (TPR) repeat protein